MDGLADAPCYEVAPILNSVMWPFISIAPRLRKSGFARFRAENWTWSWQAGTVLRVSVSVSDVQQRLQSVLGLSRAQATRAVDEVLDSLGLEVDEFIARRHGELQAQGENNAEIFERIAEELRALRFKAPELSARQIRRRIYG